MNKYQYTDSGLTFERVSKTTARKAYNNGLRVVFCPCKLRPGYPWHPEGYVHRDNTRSFDSALVQFEYFMCNAQAGRYTAFYLPVVYTDMFTGEAASAGTEGARKQYDYRFMEV